MSELLGPYAKPRAWLLKHLKKMRFKNDISQEVLESDWSHIDPEQAAYVIGTIWGRMRQVDNSLENNTEYLQLLLAELAVRKIIQ